MTTVPAQSFSAPARACVIAAARFMPGVCAVLTSSSFARTTRTPRCFHSDSLTAGIVCCRNISPTRAGSIVARPRSEEIAAVAHPQQGAAHVHFADADVVEARVELELAQLDADRVPTQEAVVGADGDVIAGVVRGRGDSRPGVGAVLLASRGLARGAPFRAVSPDAEPDVGFERAGLEVALDADVSAPRAD